MQQRDVFAKQLDQRVSEQNGGISIETPLRKICIYKIAAAGIALIAGNQTACELPCITQAEVEALARDRMQYLCRVSDQHRSLRDRACCRFERKRKNAALARRVERPESTAERTAHVVAELGFIQNSQFLRTRR